MKQKRILRPGLMIAAAFFLFNPNVNVFDILPDCFGYLLLLGGIRGLYELVPHFAEAGTAIRRLALFSLIRIPASLIVTGIAATDREFYAVAALGCGILELILLLPAIRELFAGMDYLGERFDGPAAIGKKAKRAARACYIVLMAKPILAFLPEISLVSYSDRITNNLDMATFRPHFTVLACLVGLGLGIYFLCAFIPFCRALAKDAAIEPSLRRAQAALRNPLRANVDLRRLRVAFWLLAAGAFCLIEVVFDNISYLPNTLAFAAFAVSAALLTRFTKRAFLALASAVCAIPVSVIAYVQRAQFFAEYGYHRLGLSVGADELYASYTVTTCIESLLLLLFVVSLAYALSPIIRSKTGYQSDNVNNYSSHLDLHRALGRCSIIWAALGGLCGLASAASVYLRRITERVEMNPEHSTGLTTIATYGWIWIVALVAALAFWLYTLRLTSALQSEVELKHRLEADA
ncbi:MAG: hypothetical protein IJ012_01970 [Clostridia bacterium]|nr:hypothetical protein [Clostridia bacterium]